MPTIITAEPVESPLGLVSRNKPASADVYLVSCDPWVVKSIARPGDGAPLAFQPHLERKAYPMSRLTRILSFATVATVVLAGQAFAHAHLKSAVPADKETVAKTPATLQLKFSEGVDLGFTGVTVTGPGKAAVATGTGSHVAGDDATLSVPLSATLAPGRYTVNWHALATDGHKTSGSYSFTVKP